MGAFISYVLTSQEHDTTRLVLKVVMQTTRWAALGLSVGDLVQRLRHRDSATDGDRRWAHRPPTVLDRRQKSANIAY
jgi:hypothetical protein